MASFARYACRDSFPGCPWWTDKVGEWAERVREHVQAAHPTRPELVAMPAARDCCHGLRNCEPCQWVGGYPVELAQSGGPSALMVPADITEPLARFAAQQSLKVCRTCHTLPCACPQDAIAPRSLATDGTDFHDSPVRDCRVACPICGYIGGPLQAHRKNRLVGWERIERGFVIWVPPAPAARPSVTFNGDTWDEVRAAVRVWLAGEDAEAAVQAPGKEGRS